MKKSIFCLFGSLVLVSAVGGGNAFAAKDVSAIIEPEVDPTNPFASMNWYYVANSNYIISPYGWRADGFHKGFDIGILNQPVYNSQSGSVLSAGFNSTMGTYVSIKTTNTSPYNSNKLVTRYLHLSSKSVSTGNSVSRGQQLGVSGNSGASEGPHLHFDVNDANTWDGAQLNEYNTYDPEYFWPTRSFSYASILTNNPMSNLLEASNHAVEDNNPENFFEDTLIDYVGQQNFEKWMSERPVSERKLSKFKKHFNISDHLEKKLHQNAINSNGKK